MSITGDAYYSKLEGFEQNGIYYIHLHSYNIGRAAGSKGKVTIAGLYSEQKNTFTEQAIQNYKDTMRQRMSGTSQKALAELFETDDNQQLTYFDEELRKAFEQNLSIDKLQKLFNLATKDSSKNTFGSVLRGATQVSIQEYNKLLNIFKRMADIINGPYGSALAAALASANIKNNTGGFVSTTTAGMKLKQALQNALNQLKTTVWPEEIKAAITQIEYLANSLIRGETASGDKLTKGGIKKIAYNIVSAGFAESLAGDMKQDATQVLGEHMKMIATGTDSVTYTDLLGWTTTVPQGKQDVKYENVSFSLNREGTTQQRIYNLDVGISSKFYLTKAFLGGNNKLKGSSSFSSGAGDTLGDLIASTFQTNYERYLVYNAFATLGNSSAIYGIQQAILMKNINIFFAGRSAEDFNSLIIANGKIISTWQLIQAALKSNIGASSSKAKSTQPISLSIPDREKIINANTSVTGGKSIIADAWMRSKNVNTVIKNAKVTAHLNLIAVIKATNNF